MLTDNMIEALFKLHVMTLQWADGLGMCIVLLYAQVTHYALSKLFVLRKICEHK